MSIRFFLKDLEQSSNSKVFKVQLKNLFFSHSLHMTLLFRLGQSANNIPAIGRIFGVIIEYILRILFSSDLSCRANIGPGFMVIHGHDIVIGSCVIIGRNCKIFNGVTLGNKDFDKPALGNQPLVGDNCTICTGAKVIGPIKIGNNAIVAANAVVLKEVMPNTIVGGIPAKVIKDMNVC
jgi:serine O-acetyltransferase